MKRNDCWGRLRKRTSKCPCCSPYNMHPRKSNVIERRMIRRKLKQQLRRACIV